MKTIKFPGSVGYLFLVLFLFFALLSNEIVAEPPSRDLLPAVPVPSDTPLTKPIVELGRNLFFDPRLSLDGTVSCASCHHPMGSGADGRSVSVGLKGQKGGRNAPTVFNSAYLSTQFWDGRAKTLEDQAKGPLTNPVEMGMPSHTAVMERVKKIKGYRDLFAAAFPTDKDPVNIDNLARAIATFERSELILKESAFDRFLKGDQKAISDEAKKGYALVQSVGCRSCHSGPNFSGAIAPSMIGAFREFPQNTDSKYVGRYDLLKDQGKGDHQWRVAPWRTAALTAPYFHNGKVANLKEAIRVMADTQLFTELSNEQVDAIYAFFESMVGENPEITLPRLPQTLGETPIDVE